MRLPQKIFLVGILQSLYLHAYLHACSRTGIKQITLDTAKPAAKTFQNETFMAKTPLIRDLVSVTQVTK